MHSTLMGRDEVTSLAKVVRHQGHSHVRLVKKGQVLTTGHALCLHSLLDKIVNMKITGKTKDTD